MYEYIKGNIVELNPTDLVIENNSIGYKANISLNTYSKLQGEDNSKIYIHHHIREDESVFYGFYDREERQVFIHLISVSGIGPNTARMMLSSLSTEEVKEAIITGDTVKIKSIKGIGLKTAQRVIIDLKDKIGKGGSEIDLSSHYSNSATREEASTALVLLGFNKSLVSKALDSLLKQDPATSLEDLIKKSLKILSK